MPSAYDMTTYLLDVLRDLEDLNLAINRVQSRLDQLYLERSQGHLIGDADGLYLATTIEELGKAVRKKEAELRGIFVRWRRSLGDLSNETATDSRSRPEAVQAAVLTWFAVSARLADIAVHFAAISQVPRPGSMDSR